MSNNVHPFGFVPIDPRRSREKPRRNGLSMVIDDGLPIGYMRDALELSAPYIDLIKIKTGTVRLYPRDKFVEKLAMYESFDILPFLGGQFHEYVFAQMGEPALPRFYEEARAVGFRAIVARDHDAAISASCKIDPLCILESGLLREVSTFLECDEFDCVDEVVAEYLRQHLRR